MGQPELDQKLDSYELRQLKQRIALRSQLEPLDLEETKGYIQRRLQLAGANSQTGTLFPADTMTAVFRHCRGIPRLINTVCENALITAYAKQVRSITPEIVEDVAADFRLGVPHPPKAQMTAKGTDHELAQAVRTLLQLHDYLQGMRGKEEQLPAAATSGAHRHEPFV